MLMKACRPLRACNSPDSGESLVVGLKVTILHESNIFGFLWVRFLVNSVMGLLGESVVAIACLF